MHWRADLLAGLQVSLVGLPLSLGIAVASGAPPVTGLISAIIAGLIFPFLGGAYVTISGPAAGLAPALLAGMLTLGHGDLSAGYPIVLVAIGLAGLVQVGLSLLRVGKFALCCPVSAIEGMLAAIGIMIIIKQIPVLVGALAPPAPSIPAALSQIPATVLRLTPDVCFIGGVSLCLLWLFTLRTDWWARLIPAPLLVVAVGVGLGWALDLPSVYLIQIPSDVLAHGVRLPDFLGVWTHPELWGHVAGLVLTLTLIDGAESLATIAAVDKIDPYHRHSDPNRTLKAMGISNMVSSLVGGLTIIPGGMKSTTCIQAGGRTLWANAYYALFLAFFVWGGTSLINRIPLASLAAVLMSVGWRLCAPSVFRKTLTVGPDQLLIFVATVGTTLWETDLLLGIAFGMLTKLCLLWFHLVRTVWGSLPTDQRAGFPGRAVLSVVWRELFASPVVRMDHGRRAEEGLSGMKLGQGSEGPGLASCQLTLSSLTCINLIKLDQVLSQVLPRATAVVVRLTGRIIDHTSMEYLRHVQDHCRQAGQPCRILGDERFREVSDHALATRLSETRPQVVMTG